MTPLLTRSPIKEGRYVGGVVQGKEPIWGAGGGFIDMLLELSGIFNICKHNLLLKRIKASIIRNQKVNIVRTVGRIRRIRIISIIEHNS